LPVPGAGNLLKATPKSGNGVDSGFPRVRGQTGGTAVAFQGPWRRRRRRDGQAAGPRPLGCLWPLFWLILLIILLGLLFGGYRKGTKVSAPADWPVKATVVSVVAAGA
jgi:hypothetical protein